MEVAGRRQGAMMEHGHASGGDKRMGLLIAVLALCLALVETGAKSNQTATLTENVNTNDLWSFYQARTVRETIATIAAEQAELTKLVADPAAQAAIEVQQKAWRDRAARWADDPKGGDGRKQLAEKAKHSEEVRSHSAAKYHLYEYSAAAFQVAIVVVSASVVVGFNLLKWGGVVLAGVGLVLGVLGFAAPELLHLG